MKLIEAMKKIKDLLRKADDLRSKIGKYCAYLKPVESPTYPDQKGEVAQWLQAHDDVIKEICRLRIAIQKTNLMTPVAIEIGDNMVTKSIAEWIHRRRDLARLSCSAWQQLGDKNLREGITKNSQQEIVQVTIERCYDPQTRDKMIELYTSEPSIIDSRLEVVNAITDLIES